LNQLPEVIAELVRSYDHEHHLGQSFSQYWRERLAAGHEPSALSPEEHRPDVWLCEGCGHQHHGDDPPIFCSKCAALRKNIVRLDAEDAVSSPPGGSRHPQARREEPCAAPSGGNGFCEVGTLAELQRDGRRAVQIDGHELALFLVGSEVRCLDGLCPHEGGPMAQGDVVDGVVTCPWHGWSFRCDNGRVVDGNGCSLRIYPVRVEDGRILVAWGAGAGSGPVPVSSLPAIHGRVVTKKDETAVSLRVLAVIEETPDTKTIRLDNSARGVMVHRPGQHIKVCVPSPSGPTWRSFTLSSSPTRPDVLEVTVKRHPTGIVSPALHKLNAGADLTIKGPQGQFVFDPDQHKVPLVLAVARSGVTPAMSILCGPDNFAETLGEWLRDNGVPPERVHTERFGKTSRAANPPRFAAWQSSHEATAALGL
jgi:nitrite reductase/ring-hydroxylating ferredoxin subunit